MPTLFSSIGLNFQNDEEFQELLRRASSQTESLPVKHGRYLRWSAACGAELWLQVNNSRELIGVSPHFVGTSSVRVGVAQSVKRETDSPLDGAMYAWADPPQDNPTSGSYPFVFDVPNLLLYPELSLPLVATAQIAAFAHTIEVYESEEAYAQNEEGELQFASKSFVPIGLFPTGDAATIAPQSMALFTGSVLQSERRVNELSGQPFYWISVETLGGVYDVVVDHTLLSESPPVHGIVHGTFWLSGTLTSIPSKRSGFGKLWSFLGRAS